MRVKSILNQVEKYKDFVYERVRWQGEGRERALRVEVRERAHCPGRCSECGERCPGYDRLSTRQFEYVPLWGIPVYFVYALRRVHCPRCGVKVEAVPWGQGCRRRRKKGSSMAVGGDQCRGYAANSGERRSGLKHTGVGVRLASHRLGGRGRDTTCL